MILGIILIKEAGGIINSVDNSTKNIKVLAVLK